MWNCLIRSLVKLTLMKLPQIFIDQSMNIFTALILDWILNFHYCPLWKSQPNHCASTYLFTYLLLPYLLTHSLTYLLTHLLTHSLTPSLTYSMVQSPSWEAYWFAASQKIPCISWNPKVHYRTHKRPPPVSILGQPNPVHIPTSHLLEIHPNIIHPSTPRIIEGVIRTEKKFQLVTSETERLNVEWGTSNMVR